MALTDDLSFRLGDTGVILNTDSSGLPFVDIDSVKGFDSAPFRTTQRDHEGDEGGFMDAEFEKGRDLVLGGTLYCDTGTMESFLDSLKANWAPSRVQVPLYYKAPGVNERKLLVKPLGVRYDWDSLRRTGECPVQFGAYAEDPRIYDSTQLSVTMSLGATVLSGFGFNLGFNFGFGGVTSTTDQVQINVGGNRPTPPIFVINGPVQDPRILSDTANKEMVFSPITLAVGETLTVDVKNRTVKLNGTTNRRNTLIAPTWFNLSPGVNSLRFRAASSDPAAFTTVYYSSAWR